MAKRFDKLESELSAYLDGELDEARRAAVEQYLAEDPEARRVLAELRRTVGLVQGLEPMTAPPELSEELMGRLERRSLMGREPEFLTPEPRSASGRYLATAAVVFLTFGVGMLIFQQEFGGPDQPAADRIMASRKTLNEKPDARTRPEARSAKSAQREAFEQSEPTESTRGFARREQELEVRRAGDSAQSAKSESAAATEAQVAMAGEADEEVAGPRIGGAGWKETKPDSAAPREPALPEPLARANTLDDRDDKAEGVARAMAQKAPAPPRPAAPAAAPEAKEARGKAGALAEAPAVARLKELGYIHRPAPTDELSTLAPDQPQQVLNVFYADTSTQQAGMENAWVYLANNNIEILAVTEKKSLPELAEAHDESEQLATALDRSEPQYLVRGTPDQIRQLGRFFTTDTGAVKTTLETPGKDIELRIAQTNKANNRLSEQRTQAAIRSPEAGVTLRTDTAESSRVATSVNSAVDAPTRRKTAQQPQGIATAESKIGKRDGDLNAITDTTASQAVDRPSLYTSAPAASAPAVRQALPYQTATQPAGGGAEKSSRPLITVLIRLQQGPPGTANQPAQIQPPPTTPAENFPDSSHPR